MDPLIRTVGSLCVHRHSNSEDELDVSEKNKGETGRSFSPGVSEQTEPSELSKPGGGVPGGGLGGIRASAGTWEGVLRGSVGNRGGV